MALYLLGYAQLICIVLPRICIINCCTGAGRDLLKLSTFFLHPMMLCINDGSNLCLNSVNSHQGSLYERSNKHFQKLGVMR